MTERRRLLIPILAVLLALTGSRAWGSGVAASAGATWNRERAAHLLRRAGFGGAPRDVEALVALGRDAAVDRLVDYEKIQEVDSPYPAADIDELPERREFRGLVGLDFDVFRDVMDYIQDLQRAHLEALREWWIRRMIVTSRPLEEKMTLFWHGHFTSGFREVRSFPLIRAQNEFLRRHALGDFRTLLVGIAKDGAMLRYLDGDQNERSKPNENFARELMELFTMGVGQYTETDVKEAARAFTGWRIGPNGVELRPRLHDFGTKTVLGKTAGFDGEGVIDRILAQPATPRFLATKLWEFFAYPEPENEIVDALAAELRRTKYDVRSALRTILRSDAFYSDRAIGSRIKSPVELIVGTHRTLEIEPGELSRVARSCRAMGQELFQPPNVKGWDGGRAWITTSTLFVRQNFGRRLLAGSGPAARRGMRRGGDDALAMPTMMRGGSEQKRGLLERLQGDKHRSVREAIAKLPDPPVLARQQLPYDPMPVIQRLSLETPEAIVRHYATRLLATPLPDSRIATLVRALSPEDRPFDPKPLEAARRVRDVIHLVMSLPEYQLE